MVVFKAGRLTRRCLKILLIGLLGWGLFSRPEPAAAHPLGNFTVNRYTRLTLEPEQIQLRYIIDMAEIPAFQETIEIDLDNDGLIGPNEAEQYLTGQLPIWQENLRLSLNGQRLELVLKERFLEFPPGQGGLATLRLTAEFVTALPALPGSGRVEYYDHNFANRLGWQEIVVKPTRAVSLLESTAPAEDISQELRRYPDDLLQSPLAVSSASFRFEAAPAAGGPVSSALAPAGLATEQALFERSQDKFATLIAIPALGPGPLALALLAAFGWGAAHALTPGHGKTIVAAYLVGARGTMRHAVFLGLTTTLTHTAGVFILGFLTLFASQFILPEQLYPWLGLMSGVLVTGIGWSLFRGRLVSLVSSPPHHPHAHDHHHPHGHNHEHHHHGPEGSITWRSLLALGISGGLLPCPSALIVMLSAIALQRIGFGLLLIVTFSLGLAGVLTIIGVLWVQARQLVDRFSGGRDLLDRMPGQGRWFQAIPAASALFITIIGIGLTWQALVQTGLFNQ